MRRLVATVVFGVAALAFSTGVSAQTVRVLIPGTAFTLEGRSGTMTDVAGGRAFRGNNFATLILRAPLRMPAAGVADPKMQRLVIHFRTSEPGPSLRSVELREGSSALFHVRTHIKGDYRASEVITPDLAANAWDWGKAPLTVSSQSVLRLEITFPGGYEGAINSGELVITDVAVDFRKPLVVSRDRITDMVTTDRVSEPRVTPPAPSPAPGPQSSAVIYALNGGGDLLWYRHDGRGDGTVRWAEQQGKKIAGDWDVKQVFAAGNGVIYVVTSAGDLLWNRHDGRADGSARWAEAESKIVGTRWDFEHLFSGGDGVIYAVTPAGELLWYRHDGQTDGSATWAAPEPRNVGRRWKYKHVFSGGNGVIYAVTDDNQLLWFRHDGWKDGSRRWAAAQGKTVGTGWDVRQVFSGGEGVIYAVMPNGDLVWNRHEGQGDGTPRWTVSHGSKVGQGWTFANVF
ncbi:MAG TPA: tachylectin-related carbohydrate-binding protein [Thermoanaerobaculia bacterium]